MSFGQRLKQLRESAGISQKKLAELVGKPRSSGNFTQYENDSVKPSIELLMQFCTIFNVTADWLLFGKNSVQTKKAEVIEDPDLEYMITWLRVMASDGPKRLNWARCQFDDAFGDYISKKNQTIQSTIAQRNRA